MLDNTFITLFNEKQEMKWRRHIISPNILRCTLYGLQSEIPAYMKDNRIVFPRQSRSRGCEIATIYNVDLCNDITFKTNFDLTHNSVALVQAWITLQHNTLYFCICAALHLNDETILLTPCSLKRHLTFLSA